MNTAMLKRLCGWPGVTTWAVGVGLILFATHASFASVRTVALTDDIAPGTVFNFDGFAAPVLNNNGIVAFSAELNDDNEFPTGIWSEGSGSLQKVALNGEIAPGAGALEFAGLGGSLFFNGAGKTAFFDELSDFATQGVWSENGSLQNVALTGGSAPGTSVPRVFQFFNLGGFDNSSRTAFRASTLVPPASSPSSGIWSEGSGSLGMVAEVGISGTVPGLTDGQFTAFDVPVINNNGAVAFAATANSPTTPTGDGVWTNASGNTLGTLTRVAGEGQAAPGGGTFSILFGQTVALNDAGNVAFSAKLVGGSIPDGIWVSRNSTVERVTLEGETAPDTGGATFTDIETATLGIDASGGVAFTANLSNGERGLFSESSGSLQPVAVTGDTAPDSGGLTILGIVRWAINSDGQAAFLAQLSDFATDVIFAQDESGVLQRIVATGDLLEVAPGDFREVESLTFLGLDGSLSMNGNGQSSGINDNNQIAFQAQFIGDDANPEGSSGVFVTAIPEPITAAGVLATAGLLLLRRR